MDEQHYAEHLMSNVMPIGDVGGGCGYPCRWKGHRALRLLTSNASGAHGVERLASEDRFQRAYLECTLEPEGFEEALVSLAFNVGDDLEKGLEAGAMQLLF
jgi:hypothetical protein